MSDSVYCAGFAIGGTIGDGKYFRDDGGGVEPYARRVLGPSGEPTLTEVEMLTSLGDAHVCVKRSSNEVVCWGTNEYGQLGNGKSGDGQNQAKPVRVVGLP